MIASLADARRPHTPPGPLGWHLRQTAWLAAPIGMALLSEMLMGLISTIMLGGLGARALAAGGLAINLFITALLVLQGILSGVGVLAATARGGGEPGAVPCIYWSGMLLASLLAAPLFAVLSLSGPLLRALGEPGQLPADVAAYLRVLRWGVPAGVVGIGMMRQFLPAIGLQRVLMWVMPGGVLLHAALSRLLIGGGFGLAGFGVDGSAAAIVGTLSAVALAMLAILHGPRFRGLVRAARPRATVLRALLRLGLPGGAMVAVEAGLFVATGVMAGQFGAAALAAHMIGLSVASCAFMVPLALSQAATVRVAEAAGAGRPAAARRAGFCAIGMSLCVMGAAAVLLTCAPQLIVRAYLGQATPDADATARIAAQLLGVAAMFQLADGTQVAAAGALRGLQDVRLPMLLATAGYWGGGFWVGWFLAFPCHLGVLGLWWGLFTGLCLVAVCLAARFAVRSGDGHGNRSA